MRAIGVCPFTEQKDNWTHRKMRARHRESPDQRVTDKFLVRGREQKNTWLQSFRRKILSDCEDRHSIDVCVQALPDNTVKKPLAAEPYFSHQEKNRRSFGIFTATPIDNRRPYRGYVNLMRKFCTCYAI